MTTLLIRILDVGGLLVMLVGTLLLRALLVPLAGLTAGICVVLVLCRMLVDKDYRKSSFMSELDKQKLLDGNGS
jgi:hypothetical protein